MAVFPLKVMKVSTFNRKKCFLKHLVIKVFLNIRTVKLTVNYGHLIHNEVQGVPKPVT